MCVNLRVELRAIPVNYLRAHILLVVNIVQTSRAAGRLGWVEPNTSTHTHTHTCSRRQAAPAHTHPHTLEGAMFGDVCGNGNGIINHSRRAQPHRDALALTAHAIMLTRQEQQQLAKPPSGQRRCARSPKTLGEPRSRSHYGSVWCAATETHLIYKPRAKRIRTSRNGLTVPANV